MPEGFQKVCFSAAIWSVNDGGGKNTKAVNGILDQMVGVFRNFSLGEIQRLHLFKILVVG